VTTKASIESKLKSQLAPSVLIVDNESHFHNVPEKSETHFKITVVAESFDGKRSVLRHQLVYRILAEELSGDVHALAIHTYTPEEWGDKRALTESPPCLGGTSPNSGGA
jgi:BolA protein